MICARVPHCWFLVTHAPSFFFGLYFRLRYSTKSSRHQQTHNLLARLAVECDCSDSNCHLFCFSCSAPHRTLLSAQNDHSPSRIAAHGSWNELSNFAPARHRYKPSATNRPTVRAFVPREVVRSTGEVRRRLRRRRTVSDAGSDAVDVSWIGQARGKPIVVAVDRLWAPTTGHTATVSLDLMPRRRLASAGGASVTGCGCWTGLTRSVSAADSI